VDESGPAKEAKTSTTIAKLRPSPTVKAWGLLILHGSACIAVALAIALAVNGYEAVNTSSPRHVNGTLLLRVSDVTTLVSVGLVVVKILGGSWSTLAVWACGHYLLYGAQDPYTPSQVSFMIRWKLPFRRLPASPRNWVISIGLLLIFVQALISPLLSGAVNWNVSSVASGSTVWVNSTDPTAAFSGWYWYFTQVPFNIRPGLRAAAGYASLMWADSTAVSAKGTSLTGNGCRMVVNNNDLPQNSTLENAVIPCINIHGITWYTSANNVSVSQSNLIEVSDSLSLVGDSPSTYYNPGESVVFDPSLLWDSTQNTKVPPVATMFSGTKTVGLLVERQDATTPPCIDLDPTIFGSVDKLGYYFISYGNAYNKNCYLVGDIHFTAGVTTSAKSKYIASRVVEDQTPIDEVIFSPNAWVQESIWLLPDLMTMISVMNSSQLPTYNNIDGYVELLLRQSYTAAWSMYHNSYDEDGILLKATPQEPRLKADVSFPRVFSWLALCLLMTVSGIMLLVLVLRAEDLVLAEKLAQTELEKNGKELGKQLRDQVNDSNEDMISSLV